MESLWTGLMLVPVLIAANAFFVMAEYALVAVRGSQIDQIRRDGALRAARAMDHLKRDMAGAIGAIQVCITMTNLLLGWIGEPAMSRLLAHALAPLGVVLPATVSAIVATTLGFLVVTLLTVVLSELVPKALTLKYTIPMAKLTAVPILQIRRLVTPLVWLMNIMASLTTRALGLGSVEVEGKPYTAEEIRVIAAEAHEAGILTPRERQLILNSLSLGRKTAQQIMVPRVAVSYLDLEWSIERNLQIIGEHLYSRLPLCRGGMDHVLGVVYTKEFLTASQEGADSSVLLLLARPAVFMPQALSLDQLLTAFHESGTHLIFLVDEYGGVEGIVTLHDVVEELVGEIAEATASDAAPAPVTLHAGESRVVSGQMNVLDLAKQLGREGWADADGVATVAGLITKRLGTIPEPGDEVIIDGVTLHVLLSDGRTVQSVQVTPAPKFDSAD